MIYQIQDAGKGHRLRQATINVHKTIDERIILTWNNKELSYKTFIKQGRTLEADDKTISPLMDWLVSEKWDIPTSSPHGPQLIPSIVFGRGWDGHVLMENSDQIGHL